MASGHHVISGGELARRAGVSKQIVSKLTSQGKLPRILTPGGKPGYDENAPEIQDYIARQSSQRRNAHRDDPPRAEVGRHTTAKSPPRDDHRQDAAHDLDDAEDDGPSSGGSPFEDLPRIGGLGSDRLRGRKRDDDGADSYSVYERRKMKASAERIELQNKITRDEYLPRDGVFRLLGKIYSVHTSTISPLGSKVGDQVAAEFGVTDPAKVLRAQEIIDDEAFGSLSQIKRLIDDYLASVGSEVLPS